MSWIQYFWKWMWTATSVPVRITEITFLLLTIVGLWVNQKHPNWELKMIKLAWQLPLGFLVITLLISLGISSYRLYNEQTQKIKELEQQLEVARRQAYPPISNLMMEPFFKDKDIPLGDFGLVNTSLEGKTFQDCRIHGPMVIFIGNGTNITQCAFSGNLQANFIVTSNEVVGGVLEIKRCTFINCSFKNISFIGNKALIDKIKAGFNI